MAVVAVDVPRVLPLLPQAVPPGMAVPQALDGRPVPVVVDVAVVRRSS